MTQALNLANFANNLNTSGATTNAGLQNSSVTVTAGTGMSGGGAVSLGSSVTLNNAGVTSVTAGTGISVSAATGAVTISSTSSAPTTAQVLSATAGASWGAVGTYMGGGVNANTGSTVTAGSNYAAGGGNLQAQARLPFSGAGTNVLSGTWKHLGGTELNPYCGGVGGVLLLRVA